MARIINLDVELLPEGVYLGTSEDVQGLVVQADTVPQVIDIALDLSPQLLEWHEGVLPTDLQIVHRMRQYESIAAE